METRVAEVADAVHQLATFFPEMNFVTAMGRDRCTRAACLEPRRCSRR